MDIIKYVSSFLQIAVFLGFGKIVRFSDCLTLSGDYGQNSVKFTCVISPYTSSQTWYMDSETLAICGAISCSETASNPQRYSFTTDLLSGEFTFSIKPIESNDTNKIVECFDGTETQKLTITTDKDQNNTSITNTTSTTVGQSEPSDGLCRTRDGKCIGLIIGCIIAFLWLIGFIRFCYNCCCKKNMSEKDDCINCIKVLLCIPIIGVIVAIILILDCKTCKPGPPKNFRKTDDGITVADDEKQMSQTSAKFQLKHEMTQHVTQMN